MKGFKTVMSASATLDGIEVAHMIRKKPFGISVKTAFQQFDAFAGSLCPEISEMYLHEQLATESIKMSFCCA